MLPIGAGVVTWTLLSTSTGAGGSGFSFAQRSVTATSPAGAGAAKVRVRSIGDSGLFATSYLWDDLSFGSPELLAEDERDFETGFSGLWTPGQGGAGTPTWTQSALGAHSGSNSARLAHGGSVTSDTFCRLDRFIPVDPSTSYTFSAWVRQWEGPERTTRVEVEWYGSV